MLNIRVGNYETMVLSKKRKDGIGYDEIIKEN